MCIYIYIYIIYYNVYIYIYIHTPLGSKLGGCFWLPPQAPKGNIYFTELK